MRKYICLIFSFLFILMGGLAFSACGEPQGYSLEGLTFEYCGVSLLCNPIGANQEFPEDRKWEILEEYLGIENEEQLNSYIQDWNSLQENKFYFKDGNYSHTAFFDNELHILGRGTYEKTDDIHHFLCHGENLGSHTRFSDAREMTIRVYGSAIYLAVEIIQTYYDNDIVELSLDITYECEKN